MTKPQNRPASGFMATLKRWFGVPVGTTDADFWAAHVGVQSSSGQMVSEQTMLSLSAVWACVRLISEAISTLPLSVYERTPGGKRLAAQHPLHSIIHTRPNVDSTASVHWESTVAAMLMRGNARAEKLMVGGRLVGLKFLAPSCLAITRAPDGRKTYRYTENGRQREIPASRIFNIPGFSLNGVDGVSVITHGANVFGAAMAADGAANKTFEHGLMPAVYFKMERVLTKEQREEFRENLKAITGAFNAGKSPLLEGGMSAGTIGINPSDAQLLESRSFGVEEICRWFRVPPFMIGHSEKSTSWGSGIEQQVIGFLTFTLVPWLRRIEQAINKDLLSPADQPRYYAEFNVEGLLRADSTGRAAFYSQMTQNGIYTRDDCRERENLERRGGNADVLTVQSNLVPLDQLGKAAPAAEQVRAALTAWLSTEEK